MYNIIVSFLVGGLFGAVCRLLNLPLPGPTAFAGIASIIGVWAGFVLLSKFM